MDTPTLNPSPIKEGGTLTAQASPSLILGRGMGEMSSIFTTPTDALALLCLISHSML